MFQPGTFRNAERTRPGERLQPCMKLTNSPRTFQVADVHCAHQPPSTSSEAPWT